MEKTIQNLDQVEINYITFESGDKEAMIDCQIRFNKAEKKSKLIISMSDLKREIVFHTFFSTYSRLIFFKKIAVGTRFFIV